MNLNLKLWLQNMLASYGADPSRWPVSERDELLPHLEILSAEFTSARRIDQLLNLSGPPAMPVDLESRLMTRINNVHPFSARPAVTRRFPLVWGAALPLAASLALGIYLGAMGSLDALLPDAMTGELAPVDDDDSDISGVTEATDYSGDQLS